LHTNPTSESGREMEQRIQSREIGSMKFVHLDQHQFLKKSRHYPGHGAKSLPNLIETTVMTYYDCPKIPIDAHFRAGFGHNFGHDRECLA